MSWLEHHKRSERFAAQAEISSRTALNGRDAQVLYEQAAWHEELALWDIRDKGDVRTFSITAVSCAALYLKSGSNRRAWLVARACQGVVQEPFGEQLLDIERAADTEMGNT